MVPIHPYIYHPKPGTPGTATKKPPHPTAPDVSKLSSKLPAGVQQAVRDIANWIPTLTPSVVANSTSAAVVALVTALNSAA
jgi:hypothetical protein